MHRETIASSVHNLLVDMTTKSLPPNFFHCPPLTHEEKESYKHQGVAAAYEVVKKTKLHGGPIKWKLNSDERDLKIYKGIDSSEPATSSGATALFATIEVVGTMDEVVDLFRSQTTEQAKEYVRRFGNLMADAVNLYTIVPATPEEPHEMIGISWRAFKPPVEGVVKRRDACVLDVHHAFPVNGKRVWVRCIKSIEIACCPDLEKELGYIRMNHKCTGHVFSESDRPGYLHIDYLLQSDVRGTVGDYAKWIVDLSVKRRLRSAIYIDRFLRENRLSKTPFLNAGELQPLSRTRVCSLCSRWLRILSKKSNCLKCGFVFCHQCIQHWHVKNRGFDAVALVCNRCALGNEEHQKRWLKEATSLVQDSNDHQISIQRTTSRSAKSLPDEPRRSLSNYELLVAQNTQWMSPRVENLMHPQ
ncbi:hypothetical protein AC1031_009227 [Aphanomyces cochlioides]|nr:hypothetical protein AC1031_009227 [Aphanomyces cochlioides]